MKQNLNSLFSGNFLIHPGYAASFVPTLYKAFTSPLQSRSENDDTEYETSLRSSAVKSDTGSNPGTTATSVIVLNIKQPIVKYSDYWMDLLGSKSFMSIMDAYKNDPNVAGIVLDIDSGGGQVYGTGEFYDYIKAYPKPIVSYTDGYMCSAAYYIGNAAKYIVANKRADAIGSIGAYAYWADASGILEKLGAKVHEIYATASTEKNKPSREADKGNYEPYIKTVLDPIVNTFHADMKATRATLKEEVFAGGVWSGAEALSMGLVDELGTLQTAIDKVYELSDNLSNNPKNNTMSKERANLQAVLGLTAPLVETAEKGSYLNADQLDATETALADKDASIATLTGTVTTAQAAQATAETALADANKAHNDNTTALTAQADAMLTAAALPVAGTLPEKLTALTAHYATANAKDGADATKTAIDASGKTTPAYVDACASHNQIANELFKSK